MSKIKIMAVASEGGHWKQLCRLSNFLSLYDVCYVSTSKNLKSPTGCKVYYIPDANKEMKFKVLIMFFRAFLLVIRKNPSVIISTGAAPGFSVIFWGAIFRKKTVWIDSIANAEELSLSGRLAMKFATYTLTQWPDLADENTIIFKGSLIK